MLGLHPGQTLSLLVKSFLSMDFYMPTSEEVALKQFRSQVINQRPQILKVFLAIGKDKDAKRPRPFLAFSQ